MLTVRGRMPMVGLSALVLGALYAVSFLIPGGWVLEGIDLAALFALALAQRGPWSFAKTGFCFGLGWFLIGISWIYVSLHTYGFLPWWLAALATFLLCAYLALFPAFALAAVGWLARAGANRTTLFIALPIFWCGSELLRGVVFTGFPWLATGYAQIDGPLRGYAPLFGVNGIGLLVAALAVQLYAIGRRGNPGPRARLSGIGLLLGLPLLGLALNAMPWSAPTGAPLKVRLLQGNVAQDTKFDRAALDATFDLYFKLIEAAPADLVVLPETAMPVFFEELPEDVVKRLHDDANRMHMAIAVGVPVADSATVYTNSLVAFTPNSVPLKRYDKAHLVPFGEFVPLGFHWFVRLLRIPLGDFTSGQHLPAPMLLAGQPIGFNICYEDLFGMRIAAQARQASVLINASNVAWFGDSLALPEHLQIARMRALESARPMLRATNTGISAAIDAHGAVLAQLAPYTRAALESSVQPMQGVTPYSRAGDVPLWLLFVVGGTTLLVRQRRHHRRGHKTLQRLG